MTVSTREQERVLCAQQNEQILKEYLQYADIPEGANTLPESQLSLKLDIDAN